MTRGWHSAGECVIDRERKAGLDAFFEMARAMGIVPAMPAQPKIPRAATSIIGNKPWAEWDLVMPPRTP